MAIQVGDHVFLPNQLVSRHDRETAVGRFKIAEIGTSADEHHQRSIRVVLGPDEDSENGWVAKSLVHEQLYVRLLRIGDLFSETGLLDPLTKSLVHFFRLLVGQDYFRVEYIRTRAEFERLMVRDEGTTHLILVAHGRRDAVEVVGGEPDADFQEWMDGEGMGQILQDSHAHVLSLACFTGYAAFAKVVSSTDGAKSCGAPMHDLHGAVASQFTQTLFAEHLLHGRTWPIAFRQARDHTTGTSTFRLWVDGSLSQGVTT